MQPTPELIKVIEYMKAHWPSQVKPEWQVGLLEYPPLVEKVLADFTLAATKNRQFIRIAGLSGSGKTTQILPAVEAYCEKNGYEPILVAARRFVEYHPHYQEIKDFYGDANLRKMTDEFATIMLFLTLTELLKGGYDVILDVTLLDPEIEAMLLKTLKATDYQMLLLMIAVSPIVTAHFLASRAWRHTKETEEEFVRATSHALDFYAKNAPEDHIILWSAKEDMPKNDDDARRNAKITYLTK